MKLTRLVPALATASALLLLLLPGCGSDRGDSIVSVARISPTTTVEADRLAPEPGLASSGRSDEFPEFDPANFVAGVNHPYFPLVPGTVTTFLEGEGDEAETVIVEVLHETRDILGIAATVVRDRVYVQDALVEDTFDWYAQDREGNVWYLGEDVKNYEDGQLVDTHGSWETAVDGAMPGIQMPAHPTPGQAYSQELAPGVAEDEARIRRTGVAVEVPYGAFENCVQILEWTKLEPGSRGFKFYAEGVGLVLESDAQQAGRRGRVELVSVEKN